MALDFIQESARGAGFMACSHTNTVSTGTENLLNAAIVSPMTYDFAHGVGGYEAIGSSPGNNVVLPAVPAGGAGVTSWTPATEVTFPGAANNKQVTGSDVLILRSVLPRATPGYVSNAFTAGAMSFQALGVGSLQSG